jgi:hypothetical protein
MTRACYFWFEAGQFTLSATVADLFVHAAYLLTTIRARVVLERRSSLLHISAAKVT